MSVQEALEVENADDWEIHFVEASKSQGQTSMVSSTSPSEEEVEWANIRMLTLQMAQCSQHPDEGLDVHSVDQETRAAGVCERC